MPVPKFKSCLVEGCQGNASYHAQGSLGYCNRHLARLRRNGDPLAGKTPDGESMRFLTETVLSGILMATGASPIKESRRVFVAWSANVETGRRQRLRMRPRMNAVTVTSDVVTLDIWSGKHMPKTWKIASSMERWRAVKSAEALN